MKKKLINLLILLVLMSVLMTGCSGGSGSDVKGTETLSSFKTALASDDENSINNYIPEEGIKIANHLDENNPKETIIKSEDINGQNQILLFELLEPKVVTDNGKTIISGEPFIFSLMVNVIQNRFSSYDSATASNSKDLLEGLTIDIDIPENMKSYYSSSTLDGRIYQEGYNITDNGEEIITASTYKSWLGLNLNYLENRFKEFYNGNNNDEEFKIKNAEHNFEISNNTEISGYDAKYFKVFYDVSYKPIIVDITIENNKIIKIFLRKEDNLITRSLIEKAYYANQDGNIHAVAYIGEQGKFDEAKFDSVLDSFEITK